jgi:hypothetical protein
MVACTQEEFPQPPNDEHPVTALLAVVAMILAMLLITWARFELLGTEDIEGALTEDAPIQLKNDDEREIEAAVTTGRFATGLSP